MAGKKQKDYDDYALVEALAKGQDSITQIAAKFDLSISMVYHIASGETRPELKDQIDQLINAYRAESSRILRSRGRFFAARLIQLAEQNENLAVARDAVELGLKIGGVITPDMAPEERANTINLIMTSEDSARKSFLRKKLTGVVNTNAMLDAQPEVIDAEAAEVSPNDNGESYE